MSSEMKGVTATGQTVYAYILNTAGKFWNGTTFETFSTGNYLNYDVAMVEFGTTGIYYGDFPTGITSSGTFEFFVKRQQGVAPAQDDPTVSTGKIDWTGSSSVSAAMGSMSGSDWRNYVLRGGFKRTDKDTELYEETTDAIQEMRRRFMFDEAEAETTTTDTITILGDFKIDVEPDFGLLLGVLVEDGQNATPLIHIPKSEFDKIYSDINVTANRGYPRHFTIYAGSIQLGPIPDRISYSYRMAYSKRAGIITNITTGVPFTRDYRDVLRDNVLARLYKDLNKTDLAQYHRSLFEDGFKFATRRETVNSGDHCFNVRMTDF